MAIGQFVVSGKLIGIRHLIFTNNLDFLTSCIQKNKGIKVFVVYVGNQIIFVSLSSLISAHCSSVFIVQLFISLEFQKCALSV